MTNLASGGLLIALALLNGWRAMAGLNKETR